MLARGVQLLRTRMLSSTATTTAIGVALLVLWVAGVVLTTLNHEYWRDEVRAWSLARTATSPVDLFAVVRYEGHPVLWYLLLFIGTSIVDSSLILPVASFVVALAAAVLLVWRSPFELWVKALFMFGALPFYEYAVVARNYGISMLLLFVAAVWYRERFTRPVRLAIVLALLANTNVHSAVFTGIIAALCIWEIVRAPQSATSHNRALLIGSAVIVGLGLALCAGLTWPPADSVLVSRGFTTRELATAGVTAAVRPGKVFGELAPSFFPSWVTSALLLSAIVGLARQPRLALTALAGMVALGALFSVVYPGSFRHQGLLLIFLVALYWIALDGAPATGPHLQRDLLRTIGLHGAMAALMLAALVQSRYLAWRDLRRPMSSSKAFAEFLARGAYRDAIIIAEPGYFAESLPYYVQNRLYFPREHRFGTTVTWRTGSRDQLTLSDLVDAARYVAVREGQPVLILLGHREVRTQPSGTTTFPYDKTFSWTPSDRELLASSARPVADFSSAVGDENYSVYALLPAGDHVRVIGTPLPARLSPSPR